MSISQLAKLSNNLMDDLQKTSIMQRTDFQQYGTFDIQIFQPRHSKPIIDKIDTLLAKHYGFTPEELDYIVNYDIKYRMGDELEGEEK
jgi:hypothetical protein